MIDKIGTAFAVWAVLLFICNPWFESRKTRAAMILCAMAATVCWVVA